MTELALEYDAINLGQGFPDEDGPSSVRLAAAISTRDDPSQYPPMMRIPELLHAVAKHDRRYYGLDIDWRRDVMVTSGTTEGLAASFLGLLNPGDEAILLEPLYDSYLPMVELAGAKARLVRLEPPDWSFSEASLTAAITSHTKLIVVNTPMNPSGKVFTADELALIAEYVRRYDLVAICDEVYEHLIFDDRQHIPLITLPDMRKQCLKISSAGKTFSLTGWKVGYITACDTLLKTVASSHQFLTFTTPPGLQHGIAFGLEKETKYFTQLASNLQRRRDQLRCGLSRIGFEVLETAGSYFLNANFQSLGFDENDVDFCRRMTTEARVTAIPISAFYHNGSLRQFVRFCFCKTESVLAEVISRLGRWIQSHSWATSNHIRLTNSPYPNC